ncbi:MAG: glycoside hydrolase family 3 N-terminal domain-containing protein, partial [Bacteroidales bacterium]
MNVKVPVIVFLSLLINTNLIAQGLSIDEKVDSVLSLMTLDEKIGQMTQVERNELVDINDIGSYGIGSLLSGGGSAPNPNTVEEWGNMYDNFQSIALQSRLGIPIIYGVDAVHGHNNVYGAVIFPHNIGLGCTWNPELIRTVNQAVAKEVAATGIDWTFAPCIAVARNERWGRTYESFGETAEIHELMASESVMGLQGSDLSADSTILSCAKHFVGDGGTTDGIDQGNTEVSEDELREIHMAAYVDAIESGVGSIMASYNSWNGEKLHGSEYLLTNVLKNELGFEGFVVSDWKGVDQIDEDYKEAIKRAINAGIDMVMVPDRYELFIGHLKALVEDEEVSINRINDAVKRILKQKFLLDLFNKPYTNLSFQSSFGSNEHRIIARQAVRESVVLLNAKNNVLPLNKNNKKILVAGTLAADLGAQCGGWSIYWQGGNGNITPGTDILTGMMQVAETSQIIYSETGDYDDPVDAAVVVIGEKTPYAEGAGDRVSLKLDIGDIHLLKKIKEKGIPTIAVLISGRPLIIGDILPYTDAIIAAWLPGTEGDGVADIIFGNYNPMGKLTHSWPKNMEQIPINYGDQNYDPLFEYKHGFSFFPIRDSSECLLPYSASTNSDGDEIILCLSDTVTDINYSTDDLSIYINDVHNPEIITDIKVADFDSSILLIHLNQNIPENENVTLSYQGEGILSGQLVLDSLDRFYVHNSVGSLGEYFEIPGRIEAEDYLDMYGIQTETCTDVDGGLNVGYIDSGDWMKYNIEVKSSAIYKIIARMAGYGNGT